MSGIKIIGGEARGRMIKSFPNDLSVRPLLGRIKKSLFDILRPRMGDARFLDLYAGTGAVGIEALSQGARKAVFVELTRRGVDLIRENLRALGMERRSVVVQADVTSGLGAVGERFEIVFLGPPYKDKDKRMLALTTPTLEAVCRAGVLEQGGIVVSQHHMKEPVTVPGCLEEFRREKYGDTVLVFYKSA